MATNLWNLDQMAGVANAQLVGRNVGFSAGQMKGTGTRMILVGLGAMHSMIACI